MGDLGIILLKILIAAAIIWFFYHGHNIVRFIAKHVRNAWIATTSAFSEWILVADEVVFGKDEDNGCKDM